MFESITKELLREQLKKGLSIGQILKLREGQDCTIYKADHFSVGDTIMYIPDFEANCLPFGTNLSIAQITYKFRPQNHIPLGVWIRGHKQAIAPPNNDFAPKKRGASVIIYMRGL